MSTRTKKTDADWRNELSADEYRITREKGTEPAFTGKYWNEKSKGVYKCRCCGEPLFSSETKYDSGTGWPSFWEPLDSGGVETETDTSCGMIRNEVRCTKCGAHLGHVFDDGPEPTRLRFCMNSASLNLEKREDPK